MKKGILIAGILCLGLASIYLALAFTYPIGTMAAPAAAIYPIFLGFVFLLASIATIVDVLRNPPSGTIDWPKGIGAWRVVIIAAAIIFFAFALEFIGYLICSAIVLLVCVQMMGMRSWWRKITFTVIVVGMLYLLFDLLLRVPLPRGLTPFE
jgi:putative tricarboxylic transport membrane protein